MAPSERHEFTPYDCTPGDAWEEFDQNLLNHCSGEVDDRGWSLADYLMGQDEGSPGGPALPAGGGAGATQRIKAQQAQRKRAKSAYSVIL